MRHSLPVTVAGIFAALFLSLSALAADDQTDRAPALQPPSRSSADAFTSQDTSPLGLRRPVTSSRDRIELPFGLNYLRNSRSLVMPLDEKSEWGVGINLNLAAPPTEYAPPALQLVPKSTPGLSLHKKF